MPVTNPCGHWTYVDPAQVERQQGVAAILPRGPKIGAGEPLWGATLSHKNQGKRRKPFLRRDLRQRGPRRAPLRYNRGNERR